MIYIAWLIKKEEPDKSIIFKQKSSRKDGKIFVCYKFRTMYQIAMKFCKIISQKP